MSRKLYEIFVPVNDNAGKRFSPSHNRQWEKFARDISGGLTKLPRAVGQWVDGGRVYSEPITPVRIVASAADMRRIADYTAKHYSQLAVMYYVVSSAVTIKSYA